MNYRRGKVVVAQARQITMNPYLFFVSRKIILKGMVLVIEQLVLCRCFEQFTQMCSDAFGRIPGVEVWQATRLSKIYMVVKDTTRRITIYLQLSTYSKIPNDILARKHT